MKFEQIDDSIAGMRDAWKLGAEVGKQAAGDSILSIFGKSDLFDPKSTTSQNDLDTLINIISSLTPTQKEKLVVVLNKMADAEKKSVPST